MVIQSLANKNKLSSNNSKNFRSCRSLTDIVLLSHSSIVDCFKKRRAETLYSKQTSPAFTVVELLVVIVVIGILAAITIVAYTGIAQRAVTSGLQSDLTNASQQLKLYYQLYSSYPTAMTGNCPAAPTADNTYCIKASSGNTLTYTSIASTTFHLTDTNTNNTSYATTDNSSPAVATAASGSSIGSACPTGFIPVPGSGTYGTNDFCVMKYAASHSDATSSTQGTSTVPISAPSIQQWVSA